MKRESDLKANKDFLVNVVDTMKKMKDPIINAMEMYRRDKKKAGESDTDESHEFSDDDHDSDDPFKEKKSVLDWEANLREGIGIGGDNNPFSPTSLSPKALRQRARQYENPEIYLDEERKRKEKLEMLSRKLQKFVAERNISFNLRMVFKRWMLSTEEWRKKNEEQTTRIGRLR